MPVKVMPVLKQTRAGQRTRFKVGTTESDVACVLGVLPFFGVVFVVWSGWISRRDSQCVCYSSPASKLDEVAICQIFRMCACDSQRSNVMQGWILSIHSLNAKHRISN